MLDNENIAMLEDIFICGIGKSKPGFVTDDDKISPSTMLTFHAGANDEFGLEFPIGDLLKSLSDIVPAIISSLLT